MAAKNKITNLRDHLFETLEALKDEEKPMELDRAKTICMVAGKLIDIAKTEVQYLKATEGIAEYDAPFFGGNERLLDDPRLKGKSNGKALVS